MKIKNSIKKVSAVAGSALMVGLTMGSAATLADFPQPFVEDDGTVASQIVVGSDGKVADVVGAVNIAASAGQAAVQTEERTAGGSTSSGWSANNGATLSTQKTNLYFGDDFDKTGLKTTMTEDDLDFLESGTVENVDGDDYDYDQYIEVGDQKTSIGSHNDLDDDQLMVDLSSNPLYTGIATFEQGIHVGDAADDNAEIELFGKQFTVSGDSNLTDDNQIVLFGGQETATVGEDSSTTVTVDGNEIDLYVDSVIGGSGTTSANVEIDDSLKDNVEEGDTFSVSGIDEEVRVDKIVYRGELDYGQRGRVVFSIGSEKLTLEHGSNVQIGSDEEDVDGTNVKINGDNAPSSAELSKLEIEVTPDAAETEYLQVGDSYEDPVFETFSFAFGGMSPEMDADSRSEVEAGTSSDDVGSLMFSDDSGNEATVDVAYDGGSSISAYSSSNGDYDWNFAEGGLMQEDTRFIVDSGDFTHLLNVRSLDDDEVTFRDVFTGTDYTATLDQNYGSDEIYIDGQQYHVNVHDNSPNEVEVTWGNAGSGDTGDATTVFPTMEDENGAMVTPVAEATAGQVVGDQVDDQSNPRYANYTLPTGDLKFRSNTGDNTFEYSADGGSWEDLTTQAGGSDSEAIQVGQLHYTVDYTAAADGSSANSQGETLTIDTLGVESDQDGSFSSDTLAAGAVVVEEEDDGSTENAHILSWSSGSDEIEVAEPDYTDESNKRESGDLDNDDKIFLTEYGTHIEYDADDSESATLHYPDNQATIGAGFVGGNGELSTSGGGESVNYEAVTGMGSLPNMARLDSEVTETTKSENHLILVGGPAVNTLVSDLVDSGDVDMSQLEGQSSGALLQTVDDAFASGQDAMVVAGVAGSDTRAAARYISNYDAHSEALEDAGSSMVLTEADYPSES